MNHRVLLGCAVVLGLFCGLFCTPQPRTNVALITVEALRRDAVGHYELGDGGTPTLDSLAATSVVFTNAQVPRGLTWPSLTSLHTSTYPLQHGVRRNGEAMRRPLKTLAGVLSESGYSTAAFLGNMASAEHPGFHEVFKGMFPKLPQHRWDEIITGRALAWVDSVREPFFLWVHYVGPHTPYLPPEDPDPAYDGPVTGTVETLSALSIGDIPATPENLSRVRSLYLEDVRWTDRQIGRLWSGLARSGRLGRTVVIATADHGEELGDHNHYVGHTNSVYEVVLGVPLMFWIPGAPPARTERQVEITDLAPTLLDLLGLASPPSMEGRSFAPLITGAGPWSKDVAYAEWCGAEGSAFYAIRAGRWKYVHNPSGVRPNGVPYRYHPGTGFDMERAELYDLLTDPGETTNLAPDHPAIVSRLSGELKRWTETYGEQPVPSDRIPARETVEELKALGYVR
jgi:arylsulfatase A-like enzyme